MNTHPHKFNATTHTGTQNLSDLSPAAIGDIGELYGGNPECIAAIKLLNGRIYATLTPNEEAQLNVYRLQGRKWGVAVSILNDADPVALAAAKSHLEADQILKSANSVVSVTVQ